ncbi:MAG TPA: type II toxin-antitoxin system HigB family toxin [Tepidisphaeraceae bacterium]|jgi:mRNA interferase HigB
MRRIVSPRRLREFAAEHPQAERALDHWERLVNLVNWRTPADVKQTFNSVDPVTVKSGRTVYVFNITRAYRLVAAIHFNSGMIYVLRIMTHKEYDRSRWKDEL